MTSTPYSKRIARHLQSMALAAAGAALVASVAAPVTANAQERFAVVIANKNYRHTGEVRYADRDARAIENALINTMGVPRRNIFKYEDASMADLRFLFGDPGRPGQLANLVSGDDSELFVYFAGHGSKEADKNLKQSVPYILGVDSRPEALQQTAYSLDTMVSQLHDLQRKSLPKGRVMLVLESCFSGRSNDGDLVKDRSAPAFGPPITLSKRAPKTNDNFVMIAAAKGDQYAVWDKKWRRSVFTDALVSGLYGEADDKQFEGNGDGTVTLGELAGFVSKRISRRLRTIKPGERQEPDVMGGSDDLALVKTSELKTEWSEIVRRSHGEKIRSALLLSSSNMEDIQSYLTDCLYCSNRDVLQARVRDSQRLTTICEIEAESFKALMKSEDQPAIRAYLDVSKCTANRQKLELRLATLFTGVKTDAVSSAPETAETAPENVTKGAPDKLLARRLQSELKRVGCLYGRVDGIWGRGSNRALTRFTKTAKVDITGVIPSEDAIAAVADITKTVCQPPKRRKATRRSKAKATVNYEEPVKKKKKTYRKKKTYTTNTKPKTYKKKDKPSKKEGGGVYIEKLCTKYGDFCG